MSKQYFRSSKLNMIEAEKRIASFVVYYDREELSIFLNDFINSIIKSEYTLSDNMSLFIKSIKSLFESNLGRFNDSAEFWTASIIIHQIIEESETIETSAKLKEDFRKWIVEVEKITANKSMQDLFILGSETADYYYWHAFISKVQEMNDSKKSFKEKLVAIKLPEIEDSVSTQITKLSGITQTIFEESKYTMGVSELDSYINIQQTNLIYVAARPSVGKSMFVVNMALENSFKSMPSLYVSLEMTGIQTKSRILSWIKNDDVDEEDVEGLEATQEFKIIDDYFYMSEVESVNGDVLYSMMENFLEEFPNGVVYLDSINLVRYTGEDEWSSLRHISRDLKKLAMKTKGVIVACCLASRESEATGMTLSSLYGGSMLEADSDVVIGLESSSKSGAEAIISPVTARILKNRNGIKDMDINLKLKKSSMRFYDSYDAI